MNRYPSPELKDVPEDIRARILEVQDGRIAADKLTVLTDPRHAIPGYDAILMVAPARANDARFTAALRPLIGRIPVEAMRTANYQVDRDTDKQTPEAAARWLASKIGL